MKKRHEKPDLMVLSLSACHCESAFCNCLFASGTQDASPALPECMLTLRSHRATVLTVSLALFLSSVGLPVIVVACEMGTKVMTKSCAGTCRPGSPSGVRITRLPCQGQLLFIERNTTAFIQTKSAVDNLTMQKLMVMPKPIIVSRSDRSFISCIPTSSPPATHDISILISSLLI